MRQSQPPSSNKTPTASKIVTIGTGSRGIYNTLKVMRGVIIDSNNRHFTRELALSIISGCQPHNYKCEAERIQQYIHSRILYVRDIKGVETIATPEKTVEYGRGDCDDMVILAASLLRSIGFDVIMLAVGFNNALFSHVLLEVEISGKWVAMELIEPLPLGAYPPAITSRLTKSI